MANDTIGDIVFVTYTQKHKNNNRADVNNIQKTI